MSWLHRIIEWAGLDDDPFDMPDALYQDAREAEAQAAAAVSALEREQEAHRHTRLLLAMTRREVAGLRRLCLAWETITPKDKAQRFARVIEDIDAAMNILDEGEAA